MFETVTPKYKENRSRLNSDIYFLSSHKEYFISLHILKLFRFCVCVRVLLLLSLFCDGGGFVCLFVWLFVFWGDIPQLCQFLIKALFNGMKITQNTRPVVGFIWQCFASCIAIQTKQKTNDTKLEHQCFPTLLDPVWKLEMMPLQSNQWIGWEA